MCSAPDGEAFVFEAQQVFQQHLHRNRQTRNIAQLLGRLGQRVIGVILAVHREGLAGFSLGGGGGSVSLPMSVMGALSILLSVPHPDP